MERVIILFLFPHFCLICGWSYEQGNTFSRLYQSKKVVKTDSQSKLFNQAQISAHATEALSL